MPSELLRTSAAGPTPAPSLDQQLEILLLDAEQRNSQARQQFQNHDYGGAVNTLEGIRLEKLRDDALYVEAKKNRDRVNELERIIQPRVLNGPHEGLLDLVEELLRLVPTHTQMFKFGEQLRQPDAQRQPKAGSKFTSKVSGVEMVLVPAGAFWMGGGWGKAGEQRVEISHDFYLGIYPVTQRQWQAVMGSNPSHFKGDDLPVEQVSWDDVQEFLKQLNAREKEGSGGVYRLPSEAEWEYACRCPASFSGGELSKHHCSFDFYFDIGPTNSLSSTQANFNGKHPHGRASKSRYMKRTTKVGSYRPNGLGIYDMNGNVWEWCQDLHDGGPRRVIRGGSWNNDGEDCRAASRGSFGAGSRGNLVGFRLARSSIK